MGVSRKRMVISMDLFIEMFRSGLRSFDVVSQPVPEDSKIVGWNFVPPITPQLQDIDETDYLSLLNIELTLESEDDEFSKYPDPFSPTLRRYGEPPVDTRDAEVLRAVRAAYPDRAEVLVGGLERERSLGEDLAITVLKLALVAEFWRNRAIARLRGTSENLDRSRQDTLAMAGWRDDRFAESVKEARELVKQFCKAIERSLPSIGFLDPEVQQVTGPPAGVEPPPAFSDEALIAALGDERLAHARLLAEAQERYESLGRVVAAYNSPQTVGCQCDQPVIDGNGRCGRCFRATV